MAAALRIGVAGLGTVGTSVISMLAAKGSELERQCGRPIIPVAVSARTRNRDRGVDLSSVEWVSDPVELAPKAHTTRPYTSRFLNTIKGQITTHNPISNN